MEPKERLLAIKLMEKAKEHPKFMEEIKVSVKMKEKPSCNK